MKVVFIIFLMFLSISLRVEAIDDIGKKKYPDQLLTDDYGILDENDVGQYAWGISSSPFSESEKGLGARYWQCFPVSVISFHCKDEGYDDEDRAELYDFSIKAQVNKDNVQKYSRAHLIEKKYCEEIIASWRKIMRGQKYVCLGGSFIYHKEIKDQDRKVQIFTWNFDKIKTKIGCDSYSTRRGHTFCGMTREEYERH